MDSGVSACSQGPIVEAPGSIHYPESSVAERLGTHPFWSSAKAKALEDSPAYTDGTNRVISANDGTKDCLALLLTPNLVAALNQMTHDIRALQRKDGALKKLASEIIGLARQADNVSAVFGNPRYRDRAEEMQLALEILQLKRQEAEERRSQILIEQANVENSLKAARCQSQTMFEEALLEACLLDPREPGSPRILHDEDDADVSVGEISDAPSIYEGTEPTPEQESLREARMDVVESYETLRTHQAAFDDRRGDYERKLAGFQRCGSKCEDTRTRFDHRHIQHVQNLTRGLVLAEQGYRTAKARARALESPADPHGFNSDFGCLVDDGHRRREDVCSEPDVDRERIEGWMCGVLPENDVDVWENRECLDEWNARPVEIMDSISLIDHEEYVDEIEYWKEHCRGLREEMFGRRHVLEI
ncbi:hypothetical protein IMSHALPRED_003247 [Imshaugia aleurites]|uniref:Uncharacterized protein n=1 Tax=Imshaugia aleurites TaxID=172621 RepID=A0A8H3IFG5_9LECA|nr:hypothetical protein IMSHALPRED_003247 [Imshaugia aleurites]